MEPEHLSPREASRFLARRMGAAERDQLERHVDVCGRCRAFLSELARVTLSSTHATPWQSLSRTSGERARPSRQETAWLLFSALRGQVLHDRFEVIGELGYGGMGVVVEVRDRRTQRNLALKTMTKLDLAGLYRFKREFREVRELRHPNLVRLDELHAEGELWFFTMERVRGSDFLAYVRGEAPKPLLDLLAVGERRGTTDDAPSWGRLRRALAQCADALSTLHRAGLVHRDIKPRNVLVDAGDRVVLLDFGLVLAETKETLEPSKEERADRVVGTPRYMSPEQARGEEATPASDWYALGVMLYEALTGRAPFEGADHQLLQLKQLPPRHGPRDLAPHAPVELDALCRQLLSPNPSDRAGAEEVRAACRVDARSGEVLPRDVGFIGRAAELERLMGALEASRREVRWIMVSGEPGVGKTALVAETIDRIRRRDPDVVVLAGRSRAHEMVPFKAVDPIVDSLSRYLIRLGGEAESLLNDDLQYSAHLFPVLREVGPLARLEGPPRVEGLEMATADPAQVRIRGFVGLRKLLSTITERRPLVIVADDLQWAGRDSRDFFREVLAPDRFSRGLFLATARTRADALSGASRAPPLVPEDFASRFERIDLGGLGSAESMIIAAQLAPEASADSLRAVFDETRGHPLFLRELSFRLARGAPRASLHELIWAEIEDLPVADRELLTALAIAGRPLSAESLTAFLNTDSTDVARRVRELHHRRLVRVFDTPGEVHIEVFHDRVREVIETAVDRNQHPDMSNAAVMDARVRIGRAVAQQSGRSRADVILAAGLLNSPGVELADEDAPLALEVSLAAARAGRAATSAGIQRQFAAAAASLALREGDDEALGQAYLLLLEAEVHLLEREGAARTIRRIVETFPHDEAFIHAAWLLKANAESTVGLVDDAVASVDAGLAHLGRRGLPRKVSGVRAMLGYLWWRKRGLALADAALTPVDTPERVRHARTLELLSAAIYPASFRSKTFFPYLAYRILEESSRHGYRLETALGLGLIGVIAFYPVGEIEVAEAHHARVRRTIERWGDVPAMAFYMMGEATLFLVWTLGPIAALPRMRGVRSRCLELGDLRSAAAASAHLPLLHICGGSSVAEARAVVPDAYAGALHQPALAAAVAFSEAWLARLAGQRPLVPVPEVDPHLNLGLSEFYRVFYDALDAYLDGRIDAAAEGLAELDEMGDIADGLIIWSLVHVVRVLVVAAVGRERRRTRRERGYARRSLARLATYANLCPTAFAGPDHVARSAVRVDRNGGLEDLDRAIARCRRDGHLLAEALGHHLRLSFDATETSRTEAERCFDRLGAPTMRLRATERSGRR